ncbi:MAG: ribonuclease D, partial [Rhodospirillaceae bacterium]|nr:ribonuclease D [Rhodospirillaceae bacterium]
MTIFLHYGDLPETVRFTGSVAVDTETMGLNPHRDRLCLVQLSAGDGDAHLVKITGGTDPVHLKAVLADPALLKIFHFARFDVAMIAQNLGVDCAPVFCTKIASKLCRTNTDRHGLKDLCRDLLDVTLSKEQQTSDWGAPTPSPDQQQYAANDVLYLHRLKEKLDVLLDREGRRTLADSCFGFLGTRAALDLSGWPDEDI